MKDWLLLMHADTMSPIDGPSWGPYFSRLNASGRFEGGSAIGAGAAYRRNAAPRAVTDTLDGFLRVRAASLEEAREFLAGNPVYEAGGTVEIRELPRDGE